MNILRTLGLIALSVVSLNSYAESSFKYQEEFQTFRQSEDYTDMVEAFVEVFTSEAPENIDPSEINSFASLLKDINLVLVYSESLTCLDAYIEQVCTKNLIKRPTVFVIDRRLPEGDLLATNIENEGGTLIIEKDFFLTSTDTEIEKEICNKLALLHFIAKRAS